jgi:hypothetical protein
MYNDLLGKAELLEDMAAYEKAKQNDDELVPSDVVYRWVDGENKIKVWREYPASDPGRTGYTVRHSASDYCTNGRRYTYRQYRRPEKKLPKL